MDVFFLGILALGASVLTFYSGFGLGTILTPVFMVYFPAEIAIALTALIHFVNNIGKFALTWTYIDWKVVLQFGTSAVIFSLIGAWSLSYLANDAYLYEFQMGSSRIQVKTINGLIGVLVLIFTLLEWLPIAKKWQFSARWLTVGGALSGFFGGLSGFQGALRSMFLRKLDLSKEAFISSGIAIACLIDISRLGMYYDFIGNGLPHRSMVFIIVGSTAALAGAFLGNKLLKKMTLNRLQQVVSIALILFSIALILGIIG